MTATKTKIRRDGTVKVKKRSLLWRSRRVVFLAFLLLVAAVSGLAWVAWQIPLPSSEPPLLETTFICTSEVGDGCTADNSVAQLSGGVDRQTVRFDQIPPVLVNAVVATEDREFFKHKGVDPAGVTRAFLSNIRGDELQQGGSTITQQYVKNTYLSSERTLERKTKEAVLAIKLEKEVSKQEILERYLNTIYFGRGAYGVGAAARTYFGKDISQLGLPEASYLAGIIRAPEAADANRPATDPQAAPSRAAATTRRRQVLDAMLAEGYVTQADHDRVDGMGWEYVTPRQQARNFGNVTHADLGSEYVIEYVRSWLVNEGRFTDAQVFGGGLRVYTTIDWKAQQEAYDSIREVLDRPDDPAASIVAIDRNGNVRAMVGGFDWARSQVNLATGAVGGGSGRQPGSSFKPFALATALNQGMTLDKTYNAPGTLNLKLNEGGTWKVSNYGDAGLGTLNLVDATTRSSNTAYAQLINDTGSKPVVEMAHKMGVSGDLPEVPSVVLGTGSVSVLDMAAGYNTFQREGNRIGPVVVSKVTDAKGRVLYQAPSTGEQVLPTDTAQQVNWVMSQVVQNGTGTKAQYFEPAAGKTGTTENYRDAWFAGFSCDLTAAVWVGYPGPETKYMTNVHGMQVAGGTFPTIIWNRFMSKANVGMTGCPTFPKPASAGYSQSYDTAPLVNDTSPPSSAPGTSAPATSSSSSSSSSSTSSSTSTTAATSSTSSTKPPSSSSSSTSTTKATVPGAPKP